MPYMVTGVGKQDGIRRKRLFMAADDRKDLEEMLAWAKGIKQKKARKTGMSAGTGDGAGLQKVSCTQAVGPSCMEVQDILDGCSRRLGMPRKETVVAELRDVLVNAEQPSSYFEKLKENGELGRWFPELEALINVPQDPGYHGEGSVWNHTMLVVDGAAKYRDKVCDPFGFMLAALCHDFGKAVCTETRDGRIISHGHEAAGVPLAEAFVHRLGLGDGLEAYVPKLVGLHMKPLMAAKAKSSVKATNHMFDDAADPEALLYLSEADDGGRIFQGRNEGRTAENRKFLWGRLATYREYMARPYVDACDLLDAGFRDSPKFQECLEFAHKLRLAGVNKENALRQTLAYARKICPKP